MDEHAISVGVRKNPPRLKRPERRTQIIDATLRLVAAHGVQGTTTARIAAAVGLSEPALYRHFANRKEMLLAALEVVFDRVLGAVTVSQAGNALERLRGIGQHHTRTLSSDEPWFVSPLFDFVVAPEQEGLRERVRTLSLRTAGAVASIIEDGKIEGSVRPNVDAQRMALRVMAFFWSEDVAYLMGIPEFVTTGLSTETLEGVLAEIASA